MDVPVRNHCIREYQTQNKVLVDTYTKLIALRNDYPSLFASGASLTWKVGVNDWNNGRTLTLKSVDGKEHSCVWQFYDCGYQLYYSGGWYMV